MADGTTITEAERISHACTFLDGFLANTGGREIFNRTEVVDLVLDVQILLRPTGGSE